MTEAAGKGKPDDAKGIDKGKGTQGSREITLLTDLTKEDFAYLERLDSVDTVSPTLPSSNQPASGSPRQSFSIQTPTRSK